MVLGGLHRVARQSQRSFASSSLLGQKHQGLSKTQRSVPLPLLTGGLGLCSAQISTAAAAYWFPGYRGRFQNFNTPRWLCTLHVILCTLQIQAVGTEPEALAANSCLILLTFTYNCATTETTPFGPILCESLLRVPSRQLCLGYCEDAVWSRNLI